MANKGKSKKIVLSKKTWQRDDWIVVDGILKRGRGRPQKTRALFEVVAEKLPYDSLEKVKQAFNARGVTSSNGVYVAHDSMGYARYVGRGNVFNRLTARFKAHPQELQYYSFYIVAEKTHEREVETLLIRAAGPQLHFNERKRRVDIKPGDVRDFEPGTRFFERQTTRGRKRRRKS